ncbi:hypothetical protein DA2_0307 [Desulfovibrio sp. A2]|nr:hypothetical protein DA2_0307 [Desulfovibrio sp. A2]
MRRTRHKESMPPSPMPPIVGNRAKRPFAVHPRAMAAARAGGTEAP